MHNERLAQLLKSSGDLWGDQALEFYEKHTAQIEVRKISENTMLVTIKLKLDLLSANTFASQRSDETAVQSRESSVNQKTAYALA